MPTSGLKLGKYRKERQLGKGGHAVVYKAYEPFRERTVAMKEYDFKKDGPERAEYYFQRFNQETEMLSELSELKHPSIVRMFDYFNTEDNGYIILEYVDGVSLDKRAAGLLKEQDVVSIGIQGSDALDALHNRRDPIVYGDLKPENTLITEKGRVVFIDFDLTRHLSRAITESIGTPGYNAPEIKKLLKGPEADMYSFAWVLYHCLTSKIPAGDFNERSIQRLGMDTDLIRCSPELVKMLQITTSEKVSERYSASQMLDRFLELYDPRESNLLLLGRRRERRIFSIGYFDVSRRIP